MDFYPLNLILAVAVASATVFLGFLPTRNIRAGFFTQQVLLAIFAWALIGLTSPPAISHYHYITGFLCFASWWQFRRDRTLAGKMWLSVASGLGISVGIMLILAVTPRAYPAGLPQPTQSLLLASIYLGGAVIGLAYVCYVMIQALSSNTGVTQDQAQRYVGLLVGLVVARAAVLLGQLFLMPSQSGLKVQTYHLPETHNTFHLFGHEFTDIQFGRGMDMGISLQNLIFMGLVFVILPTLAFIAQRAFRSGAKGRAASVLIGICLIGILTESLARLLML